MNWNRKLKVKAFSNRWRSFSFFFNIFYCAPLFARWSRFIFSGRMTENGHRIGQMFLCVPVRKMKLYTHDDDVAAVFGASIVFLSALSFPTSCHDVWWIPTDFSSEFIPVFFFFFAIGFVSLLFLRRPFSFIFLVLKKRNVSFLCCGVGTCRLVLAFTSKKDKKEWKSILAAGKLGCVFVSNEKGKERKGFEFWFPYREGHVALLKRRQTSLAFLFFLFFLFLIQNVSCSLHCRIRCAWLSISVWNGVAIDRYRSSFSNSPPSNATNICQTQSYLLLFIFFLLV